ncbi:MAG: hypothetical protein KAS72_07840 [Phycisphaerales bacterium]|nr:hypothetical protein [Phycisphaerales bacterium]
MTYDRAALTRFIDQAAKLAGHRQKDREQIVTKALCALDTSDLVGFAGQLSERCGTTAQYWRNVLDICTKPSDKIVQAVPA